MRPATSRGRSSAGLIVLALLAAVVGCSSRNRDIVPVHGRITLDGGDWPKPGRLYFTPFAPAAGFPARPGMATFGTDGVFAVTSLTPGDGLYPGTYHVGVECWENPPSMDPKAPPRSSYVAAKFESAASSGLQLEVPAGSGPIDVEFDAARRQ